jgi:hypothetical protein
VTPNADWEDDDWVDLIRRQDVESCRLALRHADERLMWQAIHQPNDLTHAQMQVGVARERLAAALSSNDSSGSDG